MRQVMISRTIPMADYVKLNAAGEVVENLDSSTVRAAVGSLLWNYSELHRSTAELDGNDFSQSRLINEYTELYDSIS